MKAINVRGILLQVLRSVLRILFQMAAVVEVSIPVVCLWYACLETCLKLDSHAAYGAIVGMLIVAIRQELARDGQDGDHVLVPALDPLPVLMFGAMTESMALFRYLS